MMSLLGGQRGREILREHETITREALHRHGGTEVKTLGDGFMASFTRITEALACAVTLQRSFETRNAGEGSADQPPLEVRIGINAGEPIEEDGDLFGATVILASRIASAAGGGEILVSNAVRELSEGKDFIFLDRDIRCEGVRRTGPDLGSGLALPILRSAVPWRRGLDPSRGFRV